MIDGKSEFLVREVKSYSGFIVHVGELLEGSQILTVGDEVVATYDEVGSLVFIKNDSFTHPLCYERHDPDYNRLDERLLNPITP